MVNHWAYPHENLLNTIALVPSFGPKTALGTYESVPLYYRSVHTYKYAGNKHALRKTLM